MIIHLDSDVFNVVCNGKKDIEVRVNDLKRQKLKVFDTITFLRRPNEDLSIKAKVIKLEYFRSLDEVFDHYEMERLYLPSYTKEMWKDLMLKFYSKEEIEKYGIVAITFVKED